MKLTCPKCKENIEVNIGKLIGSVKSKKKQVAARKRALKQWAEFRNNKK